MRMVYNLNEQKDNYMIKINSQNKTKGQCFKDLLFRNATISLALRNIRPPPEKQHMTTIK